MVRKTKDGAIDFQNLWASVIYRSEKGGKQYIFANVRRKFGEFDVEPRGAGEFIGIESVPKYEMTTDNDPDSPTFNQRIPKESVMYDGAGKEIKMKIQRGTDWKNTHEATPEMIENYKLLVGSMPKPLGDTKLYWILPEGKFDATNAAEFFDTPLNEVRDALFDKITLKAAKKSKKKNDD